MPITVTVLPLVLISSYVDTTWSPHIMSGDGGGRAVTLQSTAPLIR